MNSVTYFVPLINFFKHTHMCYVKCLEKGYDLADRPSQSIKSSVNKKLVRSREDEEESTCIKFNVTIS